MNLIDRYGISVSQMTRIYVPLVVNTSRSFPYSRLFTGFVTRFTRLVEQELLTLPECPSSPQVFSGVRVTRSSVLCVCFVDRCLSFCTFSFGHCVVCSSSSIWHQKSINQINRYTDSYYPFGIFKLFLIKNLLLSLLLLLFILLL